MPENKIAKAWKGLSKVLHKVGNFQSRVLLTLVYFILLLPIGVIVRFFSNAMQRRPDDRQLSSYWKFKQPAAGPDAVEKARRQS
jgi:hypothetical protein